MDAAGAGTTSWTLLNLTNGCTYTNPSWDGTGCAGFVFGGGPGIPPCVDTINVCCGSVTPLWAGRIGQNPPDTPAAQKPPVRRGPVQRERIPRAPRPRAVRGTPLPSSFTKNYAVADTATTPAPAKENKEKGQKGPLPRSEPRPYSHDTALPYPLVRDHNGQIVPLADPEDLANWAREVLEAREKWLATSTTTTAQPCGGCGKKGPKPVER